MNKKELYGYLMVFVSCLFISVGPSMYKKLVESGLDSYVIVSYFLFLGGLFSMLVVFYKKWKLEEEIAIHAKAKKWLLVGAVIWPILFLTYIGAMSTLTIASTTLIVRMSPLFVVILSVRFLSEKINSRFRLIMAFIFCIMGTLIVLNGEFSMTSILSLALFLALVASIANAGGEVLRMRLVKEYKMDKTFILALTMLMGGIFSFIITYVILKSLSIPNLVQLTYLICLGFGTIAIPEWLKLEASSILGSQSKVSFFGYLIPIMTAIIAYFWNGEGIDVINYTVAFMLIISGIAFASWAVKKN